METLLPEFFCLQDVRLTVTDYSSLSIYVEVTIITSTGLGGEVTAPTAARGPTRCVCHHLCAYKNRLCISVAANQMDFLRALGN